MPDEGSSAPYAYAGLDRLFHERARLGIVTVLAGQSDPIAFSDLKRLCGLTDGNLNRHLQALVEADYVVVRKDPAKRRAPTTCHLTGKGREAFVHYLAELERVLKDATLATDTGNRCDGLQERTA